jgi:hypothetical protein
MMGLGFAICLAFGASYALAEPRPQRTDVGTGGSPRSGATSPGTWPAPFQGWLLVYGRHGLTATQVGAVERVVGPTLTAVHGGEVAVRSNHPGFPMVPVQTFTVDPVQYARAAGRPELAAQLSAGTVLSRSGAALRGVQVGQSLTLTSGRRLRIVAVVDDRELGGYEMATTTVRLGADVSPTASYLLVPAGPDMAITAQRVREALPALGLRVLGRTHNGLFSSADTVPTQAQMKRLFGEFAMSRDSDGTLTLDGDWERTWIRRERIVQLGKVACNRRMLPDLRAAMEELTRRGLGRLVDTADFRAEGGCWNPRIIRFGGSQLSAHTWGAAIDINVAANPLGAAPRQDPRLVEVMERHGFTWGGRWLRPDGAHFQWAG